MPASSKTKSAISSDEESARAQLYHMTDDEIREIMDRESADSEDREIPYENYTVEIEKLNQVIDAINSLRYVIIQAFSSKKSKNEPPKPVTRPRTAIDKLLDKRKLEVEAQDMQAMKEDFGF